jgi:hypothetical protein
MPIRTDELAQKRTEIEDMIRAMHAKEKIIRRVGGATITSFADEIAFQGERRDFVAWLEGADESAIRARMSADRAVLGDEADAVLYGHAAGLPIAVVLTISRIELSYLALGEHPAQRARAAAAVLSHEESPL